MFDVDWLSLAVPLAYLGILLGSLATFSSLYRKRKARTYLLSKFPVFQLAPIHAYPIANAQRLTHLQPRRQGRISRTMVLRPPPARYLLLPPSHRTVIQ